MIVLITGVPGVGKTTLCERLAQEAPATFRHIAFGRLILEAIGDESLTEVDLRRNVTGRVTERALDQATQALRKRLHEVGSDGESPPIALLDSHAVSQDSYGFISTPDGPGYFEQVRYDAIVHLYGKPSEILQRSDPEQTGRFAATEADLERHDSILSGVTNLYAHASSAPAYFVDSSSGAESTRAVVRVLLEERRGTQTRQ